MVRVQLDMKVLRTLQSEALEVVEIILLVVMVLTAKALLEEMAMPAAGLPNGQLLTTEVEVVVQARKAEPRTIINIQRATEEMEMEVVGDNGAVHFMQAVAVLAFIQEATPERVAVALAAVAAVVK